MEHKETQEIKYRQADSKKTFAKELAVNIVFAVFLFPWAVMLLINPLSDFCYSSRDMDELIRRLVISVVILFGILAVMIISAVLLAFRRRRKRLAFADNSEIPPKRRLYGIYLRILPRNIAIAVAVLFTIGGIGASIIDSTEIVQRIFLIAGSLAISSAVIWAVYMIKGIRTMCGKCRCLFFLEHYGTDERVRTRGTLGIVSKDIYQGRKYIDSEGREYGVYNTEEHLGIVSRSIYRADYRCKCCGMRYFSFYGKND